MSPADSEIPFAFWLDPATATQVDYSLPLFNEIDFQVNEGYRRIPHGGVEVGGVLYGKFHGNSLRIEAFRSIDCEHASGPSFHLSERDLLALQQAIVSAPQDEELQGLEPVGWFIAHTRGPLRLTDREAELFRRFFPEPRRVTLLVKPERFKPTRFAFLIRSSTGEVNRDGESGAIILPLPGRAGKSSPAPAIPAPQRVESSPAAQSGVPLAEPVARPQKAQDLPTPVPTAAPLDSQKVPPVSERPVEALTTPRQTPSIRAESASEMPATTAAVGRPKGVKSSARSRSGRLLLVLVFAALLGCGAGYWAYLQLPPAIISLRIQKESRNLLVLWDPAQTQTSRYAIIRINDGLPTLLTPEQKASGIAQVPLAGDSVKIEVLAQHWARESRGIIRFVPEHPLPNQPVIATPPVNAPEQ